MFEDFRVSRNVFIWVVCFLLSGLIFTFVFSHRSLLSFEKKHNIIKSKKEELTALKIEIKQLNENISRLKTDREYVVSYAKTFGYIDKTKNEQIVRIIDTSKPLNIKENNVSIKKQSSGTTISIATALILASLVIIVIGSYIIITSKKKNLGSNL